MIVEIAYYRRPLGQEYIIRIMNVSNARGCFLMGFIDYDRVIKKKLSAVTINKLLRKYRLLGGSNWRLKECTLLYSYNVKI